MNIFKTRSLYVGVARKIVGPKHTGEITFIDLEVIRKLIEDGSDPQI